MTNFNDHTRDCVLSLFEEGEVPWTTECTPVYGDRWRQPRSQQVTEARDELGKSAPWCRIVQHCYSGTGDATSLRRNEVQR